MRRQRRRFFPSRNEIDDAHLELLLAFTLGGRAGGLVDVGAHTGTFIEQALRIAPESHHIAVEPIPEMASALRERFPAVEVHEVALADAPGEATFNYIPTRPAVSGLELRPDLELDAPTELTVDVRTLDELVPAGASPAVLKIDVEGGELNVLKGAERLLSEAHPTIVFEWGAAAAGAYSATNEDMWDLLTAHDYRLFNMDGDGPFSRERFAENEYWNWVAR
jgi:FkbM family methyltransferase